MSGGGTPFLLDRRAARVLDGRPGVTRSAPWGTTTPMTDPSIVRFRRAVASACAELESRRQEVNDLNVFPVADGDTGDNMSMTLQAVLAELDRINGEPT